MLTHIANQRSRTLAAAVIAFCFVTWLTGCAGDSYTAKGAGRGAAGGAAAGAVGGLVTALVFGGDPAEAAARGAVYGGAVGATAGAIAGSEMDRQVEVRRDARIAKLRQDIGGDAFGSLEVLADCRQDVSMRQATKAQRDANPNHALAGLWLEVLSDADQGNETKARALFPTVVKRDWKIKSEAQAEESTRKALTRLMDIREEYRLPRVCARRS